MEQLYEPVDSLGSEQTDSECLGLFIDPAVDASLRSSWSRLLPLAFSRMLMAADAIEPAALRIVA